jgi:transcription elongation factor GreA
MEGAMEFITKADKASIEARIAHLKANRPVLSQRIAEARAMGDLRENGEYHAAKEQQGMEEAEIRRLEERLGRAHVVEDGAGKGDIVHLGSVVRIREVQSGETDTVKLVGEVSHQLQDGYDEVTVTSPMGEALLKARKGETIRVNTPRGVKRFEIVEIA